MRCCTAERCNKSDSLLNPGRHLNLVTPLVCHCVTPLVFHLVTPLIFHYATPLVFHLVTPLCGVTLVVPALRA